MEGLNEVGIASEGFEGGGLVEVQPCHQLVLKHVDVSKTLPGELATQVLPDPLSRIELGTTRRLKEQGDVLRHAERVRSMGAGIVQQQDVEAVGVGSSQFVEKDLHAGCVQLRQDQPEGVSAIRVNAAIDPSAATLILSHPNWLHPTGGDPAPADRAQVPAALVVRKQTYRLARIGGDEGLQLLGDGGFEVSDGVCSVFFALGRGTLGLPPKRARTRLPTEPVFIVTP